MRSWHLSLETSGGMVGHAEATSGSKEILKVARAPAKQARKRIMPPWAVLISL